MSGKPQRQKKILTKLGRDCIYIYFSRQLFLQLHESELGQNEKSKLNIQCEYYYLKMYVSCNGQIVILKYIHPVNYVN